MKNEGNRRKRTLYALFALALAPPLLAFLLSSSLSDPTITGRATSEGSINFCFMGTAMTISSFSPQGNNILNGTVLLSAQMSGLSGITVMNMTFSYLNDSVTSVIGVDTYDGDSAFTKAWDTTQFADGRYVSRIKYTASSNDTPCQIVDTETTSLVLIDNTFIMPNAPSFNNSLSTNFSNYARWSNLSNVLLGNIYGLVNFSGDGWDFDSLNVSSALSLSNNSASLSFPMTMTAGDFLVRITLYNVFQDDPVILLNGAPCPNTTCTLIGVGGSAPSCSGFCAQATSSSGSGSVTFSTTSNGAYSIAGNVSSHLTIYDDTDSEGGSQRKASQEQVRFFANYTDGSSGAPITGITCSISFNTSSVFGSSQAMSYNSTSLLYTYQRSFGTWGNFTWNVYCNGLLAGFSDQNLTDNVTIDNTPPELYDNIPSYTWNEDTILTGLNLHNHFRDQDSDNLTFAASSVQDITIVIDSDGIVSFIPEDNFFGLRRMYFTASDPFNTTYSNNVTLTIQDVAESAESSQSSSSSSSSGGGGGGGGGGCVPQWYCAPWELCIQGIEERDCYDLKSCGKIETRPAISQACEYFAHCYDSAKDGDETGIDCGGSCQPCETCADRRKNQDETAIDCGGSSCQKCEEGKACASDSDCLSNYCSSNQTCQVPSCSDGARNQGEEGIDCGGPCGQCPLEEQPAKVTAKARSFLLFFLSPFFLLFVVGMLALLLLFNLFSGSIFAYVERLRSIDLPRSAAPPSQRSSLSFLLARLDQLQLRLSQESAEHIFAELNAVMRTGTCAILSLPPSFTLDSLDARLQSSRLSPQMKAGLLSYHRDLRIFRDIHLSKRDVNLLILKGKRILSALAGVQGR